MIKNYFDRKKIQQKIQQRLNYLEQEIKNGKISYGEIAELQRLKKYIDEANILLRQWAGIQEN